MNASQAEIIVIDDDVIMQRLISRVLLKTGYRVRAAGDIPGGLALIEEKLPDLVLCDLAMPGLTGMDFLRHCQSTPELESMLVIIVSSVSDENNVRDALALGAVAHISKPFSQAQLLQVVAEHLRPRV